MGSHRSMATAEWRSSSMQWLEHEEGQFPVGAVVDGKALGSFHRVGEGGGQSGGRIDTSGGVWLQ
jgi:hypothetical protein